MYAERGGLFKWSLNFHHHSLKMAFWTSSRTVQTYYLGKLLFVKKKPPRVKQDEGGDKGSKLSADSPAEGPQKASKIFMFGELDNSGYVTQMFYTSSNVSILYLL